MKINTRIYFDSGDFADVQLDSEKKLEKNFTVGELANKSAKESIKLVLYPESFEFLRMLQEFRNWRARAIVVNSGYRTPTYNEAVGGDKKSGHLRLVAMDWGISNQSEVQRRQVRDKWSEICSAHKVVGAINYYTHGYHLEAFSNKLYGNTKFVVRDYRKTKSDW